MTPQASLDLVASLRNSREILLESLAGITEEEARKSPGPDRWSALDCVEHLTLAEEGLLGRLKSGESLAEPIHLPEREARIAAAVANRATRAQAPPTSQPAGRFTSLSEALARFSAARERTIAFIEGDPDLRALQVVHPLFGPVSGYELTLLMVGHPIRHAAQIREIRGEIE
jgi:uncharacterized damage-inducible protein DinB